MMVSPVTMDFAFCSVQGHRAVGNHAGQDEILRQPIEESAQPSSSPAPKQTMALQNGRQAAKGERRGTPCSRFAACASRGLLGATALLPGVVARCR
jgi:hypothetical protein